MKEQEKDFQRYSSDAIYKNLFGNHSKNDHFLLADEVGLGKTVITKQVISRLYDNNSKNRIYVYYVCNNLTLADQNRKRLIPGTLKRLHDNWEEQFLVKADRLSLLHLEPEKDENKRLRIISLTPQTSLKIDRMRGNRTEKELLFNVLSYGKGSEYKEFIHAFFRGMLKNPLYPYNSGTSFSILKTFLENSSLIIEKKETTVKKILDLIYNNWYQIIDARTRNSFKETYKDLDQLRYNKIHAYFNNEHLTKNRTIIIKHLIKELSVLNFNQDYAGLSNFNQLVVLDEFQKFDDILELKEDRNSIASEMFKNSKVLIVSATPYRAYSEKAEQHYEEFKRVLQFLFDGQRSCNASESVDEILNLLQTYHEQVTKYFEKSDADKNDLRISILDKKTKIETKLKAVMVRTERYHFIKDKQKGINTFPIDIRDTSVFCSKDKISEGILKSSIKEYRWLSSEKLFNNSYDTISYWKSGDRLLNFMDPANYKFIGRIFEHGKDNKLELIKKHEAYIAEHLNNNQTENKEKYLLSADHIKNLEPITVNNEKLDYLLKEFIPSKAVGKYLWIKPSFTFYKDEFFDKESEGFRKVLIFSAWNFVPAYIASMTSYHHTAEFYNKLKAIDKERFNNPESLSTSSLNKIKISEKQFQAVRILYPSYFLSLLPLPKPDLEKNLEYYKTQCGIILRNKLEELEQKGYIKISKAKKKEGLLSKKLIHLDFLFLNDLIQDNTASDTFAMSLIKSIIPFDLEESEDETFLKEDNISDIISNMPVIYPSDIEDMITMILGSPAVCLARSILKNRITYICKNEFNNPLLTLEYRAFYYKELKAFLQSKELYFTYNFLSEGTFIDRILVYCMKAHFMAVCEEFIFMLSDEVSSLSIDQQVAHIVKTISEIFNLYNGRSLIRLFNLGKNKNSVIVENKTIPTDIALPFVENITVATDDKGQQKEKPLRTTTIRKAFNSPFFPFILVSTSTGQEGLDFHYYCKDIMHWNLPSSPIDLEQREGRINRYNGLIVRQNVAKWVAEQFKDLEDFYNSGVNIWTTLFKIINDNYNDQEKYSRGLFPHWIFPSSTGDKLRRHIPIQTMSDDKQRFNRLIEYLAYYRLALGQARQDDFINNVRYKVREFGSTDDELNEFTINLSPIDIYKYTRDYVDRELRDNPQKVANLIDHAESIVNQYEKAELKIEALRIIDVIKNDPGSIIKWDYLERLFYLVNPFDHVPDHFKHGLDDDLEVLREGLDSKIKT